MGSLKPLIPPATAESIVAKRGRATANGAGDGSTVVDTDLTEANDYWNDMTLLILSGDSDGQSRDITDFAGGTLTVSPAFSNQIVEGVRYIILPIKPSFAEIADLDVDVANILADTGELQSDWVNGGRLDLLIDAIKAKTDILPAVNTDEQATFAWDTGGYTTNETDISALFATPLTGTTRRKYSLFLDLTEPAADGAAWTECTIKVKVEIKAATPVTVDKKVIAKTDVAAGEEPGVNIDIPAVAKNVQVTLQFDVALAGDCEIPYCIVTEALE